MTQDVSFARPKAVPGRRHYPADFNSPTRQISRIYPPRHLRPDTPREQSRLVTPDDFTQVVNTRHPGDGTRIMQAPVRGQAPVPKHAPPVPWWQTLGTALRALRGRVTR